jgi:hypothetical protein
MQKIGSARRQHTYSMKDNQLKGNNRSFKTGEGTVNLFELDVDALS